MNGQSTIWQYEDYKNFPQELKPPPQPDSDGLWELHFCKWWGWNWVKKKQPSDHPVQEQQMQKAIAPKPVQQTPKKPEKKPIKNLCLCLKYKKNNDPLQKMYNTPSNSDVELRHKKIKTKEFNLQTAPTREYKQHEGTNARQVISELKVNEYLEPQKESDANEDTTKASKERRRKKSRKEWTTSSSDDWSCCHCNGSSSSTGESIEYINIACCRCCHPKEPPIVKAATEKYVQHSAPPISKQATTQTEKEKEKEKKRRRRRICVVCCSCGKNEITQSCVCSKDEAKLNKKCTNVDDPKVYNVNTITTGETRYNNHYIPNDLYTPSEKEILTNIRKKNPQLHKKLEPLYAAGMPMLDSLFYFNKPTKKFRVPTQNYSWMHSTKSDIWDQLSHLRCSNEFSSPVSGKTYNISPVKIDDLGPEPSVLLNPLSVDEELESLIKIESDVKMDLKSRIMLDVVCDAILTKDKDFACSSELVNEFTYPSDITQTESIIKDFYKQNHVVTSSKINQTALDELIFKDIGFNCSEKVNRETNTVSWCPELIVKSTSKPDYSPQNKNVTDSSNPSLNFDLPHEQIPTEKETELDCRLADYAVKNDERLVSLQSHVTKTGLVPAYKRSASPPKSQEIKKAKFKDLSDKSNISDIFKKIDEIVLRSKVNNEEIQTVLKSIPKKTFQFFTSLEVSNLVNQYPTLQITEKEEISTSSTNVTSEGTSEKQECKAKTVHVKKKNVSRPSLIPKRITESKVKKKNVN